MLSVSSPTRSRRRGAVVMLTALFAALATMVTVAWPAGADEISDKQAQAAQIAQKLDQLQRTQMQLEQSYNEANLKVDQANKDISAAQLRVDQVSKEVDQHKSEVRLYAIQAYVHGSDGSTMDALISANGDQAPQKAGYLDAATNNREDALDELASSKHKLDDQIGQLNDAKGEAQDATDEAARNKHDNDAAVADQAQLQSQVQGDLAGLVAQEQARIADQQRQANQAQLSALAAADANNPKPALAAGSTSTTGPTTTGGTAKSTTTTAKPTGGSPAPAPTQPKPTSPPPTVPSSGKGAAAAGIAMSQLGVRYTYGGASPATGFDCSGLVMWAYAQVGVSLPHPTTAQWAATQPISMSQLQVGDLVFFYGLGHVGIYIGGGTVVHAPHTGDVVRTEAIANMPVDGARRVL